MTMDLFDWGASPIKKEETEAIQAPAKAKKVIASAVRRTGVVKKLEAEGFHVVTDSDLGAGGEV